MADPAPGKIEADRAGWFVRDYFPDGVCPVSSIAFDSEGGAIGIDLSSGAFTTSGIKIGEAAIGIDFSSVSVTGHAIHMVDAFPVKVIETGTYGSAASKGVTLSDTNVRPVSFLFDDADAALTGNNRAVLSRVYLAHAQAAGATIVAIQGQLKIADNKNLGAGRWSAMDAYLEFGGTTSLTTGGYTSALDVRIDVAAAETVTVAAGAILAGIHVQTTGTGTLTQTGNCYGIYINDQGTIADWKVGISVNNSTTGIEVGACTTGINFSGVVATMGISMLSQTAGLFQGTTTMTLSSANRNAVEINAISPANAAHELRGLYVTTYPSTVEQATSKMRGVYSEVKSLLNIDNMTAIYGYANLAAVKTIATGSAALHGDVNVDNNTTVSAGRLAAVWAQVRGDATLNGNLDGIYVDAEMNVDNAIYVNVDSNKTATAGIALAGSGTYTTGISITASCTNAMLTEIDTTSANNAKIGLNISKDITNATAAAALSSTNQAINITSVNASSASASGVLTVSSGLIAASQANSTAVAQADIYSGTLLALAYSATTTSAGTATSSAKGITIDYDLTETDGTLSLDDFSIFDIDFDTTGTVSYLAGTYNAINVNMVDAGVPTHASSTIFNGLQIDASGLDVSDADMTLSGIKVTMPGTYDVATEYALYASGDGTTVALCSDAATAITIGGTVTTGITMAGATQLGLSVTMAALTAGDAYSGVRVAVTAAAPSNAYGMAAYFDSTVTGTQASHIYNTGSWINFGATFEAGVGLAICAFEGGIYDAGATLTNAWIALVQVQAILSSDPSVLYGMRINYNRGATGSAITALFQCANTGSAGYTASALETSNKVGDLPLADIVGAGVRYVRLYDAAG